MPNLGSQLGPGWFILIRYSAIVTRLCADMKIKPSIEADMAVQGAITQLIDLNPAIELDLTMGCS